VTSAGGDGREASRRASHETAEEVLGAPGNATSASVTSANATSANATSAGATSAGQARAWPGLRGSSAGDVVYGGGPLLTSHLKIYIIFYGDWPYGPAGQRALAGFVRSLGDDRMDSEVRPPRVHPGTLFTGPAGGLQGMDPGYAQDTPRTYSGVCQRYA